MALAGELLPVFLANVPYALTQTWDTHRVCTYFALGVLGAMLVVLGVSFWVKWPHMPVDPRTVAGMLYYVAGSEGLLRKTVEPSRDPWEENGEMYFYARVKSRDGRARMAVDAVW
jgi:hypothetical protein